MAEPAIGSIVETPAGRGLIRFYDAISSSSGKWVGIELNGPTGKGDGTVQGVTYFTCKPNHGMLIRPGQVKVISEPTSMQGSPEPATVPGPSRTGSAPRQPTTSPSKRQSLTALFKTILSPSKPLALADDPLGPSPADAPRKLTLLQSKRPPSPLPRPPGPLSSSSSPIVESPQLQKAIRSRPSSSLTNELLTTPSPPSEPPNLSPAPVPTPIQDDTELQELRARVRVLEAKRADDARCVRELENRLNEVESFVVLLPELQAKLASLQSNLMATERELADGRQQLGTLGDERSVGLQDQLGVVVLDKEIAEWRAGVAKYELKGVEERPVVIEVKQKFQGMAVPVGKTARKGRAQSPRLHPFKKRDERLKETSTKLWDVSLENEQGQRRGIIVTGKYVANPGELQNSHGSVLEKLDPLPKLDDELGVNPIETGQTRQEEIGDFPHQVTPVGQPPDTRSGTQTPDSYPYPNIEDSPRSIANGTLPTSNYATGPHVGNAAQGFHHLRFVDTHELTPHLVRGMDVRVGSDGTVMMVFGPPLDQFGPNGPEFPLLSQGDSRVLVPQVQYTCGNTQKDWGPKRTILFFTRDWLGVKLLNALQGKFVEMNDRPFGEDCRGITIRMHFSGYTSSTEVEKTLKQRAEIHTGPKAKARSMQLSTKNYRVPPESVTKSELVQGVAKRIKWHIADLEANSALFPFDDRVGQQWRLGQGRMSLEHMVITGLANVSPGSWSPIIRLE